jgi:hypothetical protein
MENDTIRKIILSCILLLFVYGANAQTVMLDYYFNHEVSKNKAGQMERYHYTWEDKSSSGFSILGDVFKHNGAKLDTLDSAPTAQNLKAAAIYIIVDPDTRKESPHPNYIEAKDIQAIAKWVKSGGVLLMMANDSANVELPHFNKLAAKFGMHFNNDLVNHVVDDAHFEDGAVGTAGNSILRTAHKIFMKDVCSITTHGRATVAVWSRNSAAIIVTAKYGKGTVMAVGDPWLYNEYTNGRLPVDMENDRAADDIVKWLIHQIPRK